MSTHAELLTAIRERRADRVAEILEASPALAAERPKDGPSAMLFATYMGMEPVMALVRGAVTLDACEAAALGDEKALKVLLDRDAGQANARSGDGWTPLHLAGFFGRRAAAQLLLARGASVKAVSGTPDKNQPLQATIAGASDLELITVLVAKGADVNHVGANGVTPMHSAAARGSVDLIRLLAASGAKANVKMTDGRTPADLAAERKHPEAAELLKTLA